MTSPAYGARPESLRIDDAQTEAPDWFLRYFRKAMTDVLFNIPDQTVTWLTDQVALRGLAVPIGQVIGFSRFTANPATDVAAAETTTSTTYGDLATVGPTLTGVPDGSYLVIFGCFASTDTDGFISRMSIQVNGTAAADADSLATGNQYGVSLMRIVSKTLSTGGNNTITAKYKTQTATHTSSFSDRWMVALRYANT